MISPSLIDLMSFGWLFLGGLLPSRARLRFTSYEDCATLRSANQNGAAKSKTLRLDFFREATNRFRLDFYVRQYAVIAHSDALRNMYLNVTRSSHNETRNRCI